MSNYLVRALNPRRFCDLNCEIAIHEAGHATAIYLGNLQRQLPPISFQICIQPKKSQINTGTTVFSEQDNTWCAKVEGGRLIKALPQSIDTTSLHLSAEQKQARYLAFETDIINLLVGPLAEAKYVAIRDNELISPQLVSLQSLHYYGGATNIKLVQNYVECFITGKSEQSAKIAELFLIAFDFISVPSHWRVIVALANYLLKASKLKVDFEEASTVINRNYSQHC